MGVVGTYSDVVGLQVSKDEKPNDSCSFDHSTEVVNIKQESAVMEVGIQFDQPDFAGTSREATDPLHIDNPPTMEDACTRSDDVTSCSQLPPTIHQRRVMTPQRRSAGRSVELRARSMDKTYFCETCEYGSNRRSNLKIHMSIHNREKSYSCGRCDYRSYLKANLKKHMRIHTGESYIKHPRKYQSNAEQKPLSCEFFDYKTSKSGQFRRHVGARNGQNSFTCNLCNYRCINSGTLERHLRFHTGERPFVCHLCEYRCNSAGDLRKHALTHTGEKPYACTVCDYRFRQAVHLKAHMLTHTGEKPFACNMCDYRGSAIRLPNCLLDSGRAKHNPDSANESGGQELPNRGPCPDAEETSPSADRVVPSPLSEFVGAWAEDVSPRELLRGDLQHPWKDRSESLQKPCEFCDYKTRDCSNFRRHVRTHTGEKPFTCNLCDYKCRSSGDLKKHLRIHTGERPFACKFCEYRGNSTGDLKKHDLTHSGEKPYACKTCGYRYTKTDRLKSHMLTHTGEKPFVCNMCNYRSRRLDHLKSHLKTHAGHNTLKLC